MLDLPQKSSFPTGGKDGWITICVMVIRQSVVQVRQGKRLHVLPVHLGDHAHLGEEAVGHSEGGVPDADHGDRSSREEDTRQLREGEHLR